MFCFSSEQPSNYYHNSHRQSLDGGHPFDDDVPLFQLSLEDDLLDNANLRRALVPFERLKIMDEVGKGIAHNGGDAGDITRARS